MKPTELAASGEETDIPMQREDPRERVAEQQQQREPARRSRATLVSNEKPMISPVTSRIAIESELVTTSASVRPASTAARAIGSERKRSIRPLCRSSLSPSAVTNPPKAVFWTMIPGIRKST